MEDIRPSVQCLLIEDGKILLGKRKGDPKEKAGGTYGVPAGHLEEGESIANCARREIKEETSLTVNRKNLKVVCLAEETKSRSNGRHYLHIGVLTKKWTGKITNTEPEKCAGWNWYDTADLPFPLFSATEKVITGWQSNEQFLLE